MLVWSAGCASPPTISYSRPGGTEAEFHRDRYACLQQAQQSYVHAYATPHAGAAGGGMATSRGLFLACMSARGYDFSETGGTWRAPAGAAVPLVR